MKYNINNLISNSLSLSLSLKHAQTQITHTHTNLFKFFGIKVEDGAVGAQHERLERLGDELLAVGGQDGHQLFKGQERLRHLKVHFHLGEALQNVP